MVMVPITVPLALDSCANSGHTIAMYSAAHYNRHCHDRGLMGCSQGVSGAIAAAAQSQPIEEL